MTQLAFFLRQALRGMRATSLIQLAAVGAIGAGLLLVGLAAMVATNLDRCTRDWGRGTHLTVYLQAGVSKERVASLERLLRKRAEISSVRRVDPAEARRRLAASLGGRSALLDDIEPDFLPLSLEVRLAEQAPLERVRPLVALLSETKGVEEVDHLGQWASRLSVIVGVIRHAALLFAAIIILACVYIIATTIRLGVYARREEIEIQKLVGATDSFVRGPLLVEGALQGIVGALLAAGLLFLIHSWLSPEVSEATTALLSHVEIQFLGVRELFIGMIAAVLIGLVGSSLALSRYIKV